MIRLYIVVEGATEETFVSELLYPHLLARDICLSARRIGKPGHKGGRVNFDRVRKDVLLLLKQERGTYCTTLFDFYGLGEGFPTVPVPSNASVEEKARAVELPFREHIEREMGHAFHPQRFIPYLQMHEFEGLLFSDPRTLATGVGRPDLYDQFAAIRSEFETPEDIDDGTITAPSKRIEAIVPGYSKVFHGNLAALEIGLDTMRRECPRFNAWVERLELLGVRDGSA